MICLRAVRSQQQINADLFCGYNSAQFLYLFAKRYGPPAFTTEFAQGASMGPRTKRVFVLLKPCHKLLQRDLAGQSHAPNSINMAYIILSRLQSLKVL